MHPELFRLHVASWERPIQSYGALIIVGVTVAILLGLRRARFYEIGRDDVLHVGLLGVVGGIAGAALLYILVHLREFIADPSLFAQQPGLVFYGGLLGGAGSAFWYCRHFGVSMVRMADLGAPCIAIGHAFGRVGCLMGGCCYGRHLDEHHPLSVFLAEDWRHPVQGYESAGLFLICVILLIASRRLRPRPGALFALYLGLYSVLRLGMETFFRGDDAERGKLAGIVSTSQLFAIGSLGILIVMLLRRRRPQGA